MFSLRTPHDINHHLILNVISKYFNTFRHDKLNKLDKLKTNQSIDKTSVASSWNRKDDRPSIRRLPQVVCWEQQTELRTSWKLWITECWRTFVAAWVQIAIGMLTTPQLWKHIMTAIIFLFESFACFAIWLHHHHRRRRRRRRHRHHHGFKPQVISN